ncbi:hypothetical protein M408DRAFT_331005 [Serendipita vermifera MAFF 305830]|uniref:Uncharacterized protein n=1 Tax=Serendipita vermifera MAFF 305830 TaxID=933852 RepID=A0A0C3AMM0_SERVB|nr:hypothetical protein M408DRAFT_331005 [Serendipita vermifera MAFF 305830]
MCGEAMEALVNGPQTQKQVFHLSFQRTYLALGWHFASRSAASGLHSPASMRHLSARMPTISTYGPI